MVRTGVTFAAACEEHLRWLELDRQRKPTTLRDYPLGDRRAPAAGLRRLARRGHQPRPHRALAPPAHARQHGEDQGMTIFLGVMERARKTYKLPLNPVKDLEKPLQRVVRAHGRYGAAGTSLRQQRRPSPAILRPARSTCARLRRSTSAPVPDVARGALGPTDERCR
jgi:hypothetical protein